MVFSGVTFLMYFLPVFLLVYYVLPVKFKNIWIVIGSLGFYSWGAPEFIITVVISCIIDYVAVRNYTKRYGKYFFAAAVLMNVGLLLYYKYADFFIENFNFISESITGYSIPLAHIVLPVGISFITFQKISFLVDVRRKDCEPPENFINYLLFVILFPQLIAGPIVRYKDINLQITNRFSSAGAPSVFDGIVQFVIGLSKKVLIANTLGAHADEIFNQGTGLSSPAAWTGIMAYTFQIYFDFAGYSDMAIGLGKMMGFNLPLNFNFPYTSKSITEFWRRWHITLGSWMKDYLYIPLGGNRNNRTFINLFIVFFISGLWHGASWNFVLWGVFHGVLLVIERAGFSKVLQRSGKLFSTLYTFFFALCLWVFFRSDSLHLAMEYYRALFSINGDWNLHLHHLNPKFYFILVIALTFSFVPVRMQKFVCRIYEPSRMNTAGIITTGIACLFIYLINLGEIMATGFNPFIYFRF